MTIEFKCEKHKTNNGYFDHLDNKWHCWKCKKEDEFYYPSGEIIETRTLPDYTIRLLSYGEHSIRLEVWDTRCNPKHRMTDEQHGYLSTALREYNRCVHNLIENEHKKKDDITVYATDDLIQINHIAITRFNNADAYRFHIVEDLPVDAHLVINTIFNTSEEVRPYSRCIFINCVLPNDDNIKYILIEHSILLFNCRMGYKWLPDSTLPDYYLPMLREIIPINNNEGPHSIKINTEVYADLNFNAYNCDIDR
jgi:hypothetical protein